MSLGFAGSTRVGERRRRRLASDEAGAAPKRKKRRHRVDAAHTQADDAAPTLPEGESPLDALLPAARWKLVLATAVSFWMLVGLIVVSVMGEHRPAWQAIVGFRSGHLLQTVGTLLLAGSVQWSAVIYWYRRRGRRDFAGDYRRWVLAGLTFAIALPCWTANLHREIGRDLSQRLAGGFAGLSSIWPQLANPDWNTPDLCWMVPFGAAAALYGFGLLREMLPLRLRGVLLAAGLMWLSLAAVTILQGPHVMSPAACEMISLICSTTAFWCFFHCLWMQARHVVRVTNEPPRPGTVRPLALRDAVEGGLRAIERGQRAVTSPYRTVRQTVSHWQASREERRELAQLEREERREARAAAKAAAAADREASKQARRDEKEAARQAKLDARAEAKAAKAAARTAAQSDDAENDAAGDAAGDEGGVELPPPETPVAVADRSRRGRKRKARPEPEPVAEEEVYEEVYEEETYEDETYEEETYEQDAAESSEDESAAAEPVAEEPDEDDLSHLSRKERRRLRKQRRQQNG